VGHRTARVGQEGKIARRRWLMPAEIRGSVWSQPGQTVWETLSQK
jgi:hypothetical protein